MPLALLELLGDVVVDIVMAAAAAAVVTVTVTRCRCDESDSAIIIVVLGSIEIETTASEMCCIESNGRWKNERVASASA